MRATDRLCALLDEHGIEYISINGCTNWTQPSGYTAVFDETMDESDTRLTVYAATPEQAIAATVGRKALEQRHSEVWAYKTQVMDGVLRETKLKHLVETLWKVVYCKADDPYAYVDILRQATDASLDLGIDLSRRNDA